MTTNIPEELTVAPTKNESPQPKMKLGIQPTGWTNDDFQEIGDDTPYQKILEQTEEADFEGGSTGHNYPSHLPSLLADMKSHHLKIASTWAGTAFTTGVNAEAAFADFQAGVAFLKEVDAQDVVVAELANAVNQVRTKSALTERPILNEAQWFLLVQLLNRAGKYAKEQKMQLSYHPHVGTGVMTFAEADRLMERTNPNYVGLCLDTAHLRYGSVIQEQRDGRAHHKLVQVDVAQKQLEDFTKKHASRITHVHLKNVRGEVLSVAADKNYSFYQAIESGIFTVPGDEGGELNLDPIVQILKDVGYKRWLVIEAEQDPANPDPVTKKHVTPLAYARIARGYLRKHLGY